MPDGSFREYAVEDHAWRLYRHLGRRRAADEAFVTALEMSAQAHAEMVARSRPASTPRSQQDVNVPADYPYADFQDLYLRPGASGLKGLATYRPNSVLGSVLSHAGRPGRCRAGCRSTTPTAAWRSTACRRRCCPRCAGPAAPSCPAATRPGPSWSATLRRLRAVRRRAAARKAAHPRPVRGLGQRRRAAARPGRDGQDAVDGPARQRRRLAAAQARRAGHRGRGARLRDALPAHGEKAPVPGVVAATAAVIRWRCEQLGAPPGQPAHAGDRTRCSAATSRAPAPSGTLAWSVGRGQPGHRRSFTLAQRRSRCPRRRRHGDAALRGRLQRQLPARAGRPGAACRWTCA